MPRNTRRSATQPVTGKENLVNQGAATPGRKARHRLSATELARLEDVFRQETHPSRQQKKDLAAQLRMDYKTVTIWFQNKRQTAKRSQAPVQGLEVSSGRTRADSCLRTVSSPSLNATLALEMSEVAPPPSSSEVQSSSIVSKAIVKMKPLFESLNTLASSGPREHSESMEVKDEGPGVTDVNHRTQIVSVESSTYDDIPEQEQTMENSKSDMWKRMRTLEWACERQAKRRKLFREGYVSAEAQDGDPNDAHMDSALSLLSLSSTPSKDVMRGASLLLGLKHSWRRKQ